MGRQFSFFLGPEDVAPFEETLLSNGDITFLVDQPLGRIATELPGLAAGSMRTLLARPSDVSKIQFNPIKTQVYISSDCFSQNFIECDVLTILHNGYILEGRLYYNATYWNTQNEHVQKPEEFVKWAERLYRRTKKSLTHVEKWFYAGGHAMQLRAEGFKFNQLDGWAH